MICFGGLSSSFHFERSPHSGQSAAVAWRPIQKPPRRSNVTRHTAKVAVFLWPIRGGSMDFSSQAGLRKVTLSENL